MLFPAFTQASWNADATVVSLTHYPFDYLTVYTVTIKADDLYGSPLVNGPVPNPWTFSTRIGPAPTILATIPMDGDINVPITQSLTITFSEPVITNTLVFTVTPNPGDWGMTWNPDHSTVVLTPGTELLYNQAYNVEVNVQDVDGLWLAPGPVANPWSFLTTAPSRFELLLPILLK